ncbi:hypothetical protein J7T55_002957 [Diaporthe amygdali]|uniref:uncharacterized protein n=1 Tax=Phomopsis amygdali TaxID=1214568 RepID=UPI0022FE3DD7|nr:uncharacterized protein J7T55_002957 [Diaporthe amygdali]KAJ0122444.1 hypothetical protein J7T55_002957 [Diaporthe amygdali]
MEIESDDDTLRSLAAGNSMDYSTWPLLLSTIISRLDKIANNDFPIPRIPEPASPVAPSPQEPRFLAPLPSSDALEPPQSSAPNEAASSADSSQETNKENAAPTPPTSAPAPTSTPAAAAAANTSASEPGTLPPQIVAMIAEINGVLNESFHTYPPHTIQRLAELVLQPRQHYKSLPSYLHAVDRVVHVTSGNNSYPLPPAIPDMSSMSLGGPNGVMDQGQPQENGSDTSMAWVSTSNGNAIGSDEALGGALLTPIPWLQRRSSGNRDGDGGSESGESSTLGSEGGPSPLAANQGPGASQRSSQQSSRQFETRTESTETIDGPNGVGSIETVSISINGIPPMGSAAQQRVITQGELIRQEQRAGVVPVSQLQRSGPVVVTSSSDASTATAADGSPPADATDNDTAMGEGDPSKDTSSDKSDEEMPDEEEAPHARGPDIIGAADMGPQAPSSSTFSLSSGGNMEVRGIDVEAAVGRKHEAPATTDSAPDSSDDGAVMTPASSEGEEAKAEKASNEGKVAEKEPGGDEMDTAPSSATLSARVSPTPSSKRGADDDADAESVSSKRLKEDSGDAEDPKPEVEEAAEEKKPANKDGAQDKEGKDKDVELPDQAQSAGEDTGATTTEEKEAEKHESTTETSEDPAA